jgi:hypothetical protein
LGAGKSKDIVSGVLVNGAKISGTTNGVRIKTWPVILNFKEFHHFDILIYHPLNMMIDKISFLIDNFYKFF